VVIHFLCKAAAMKLPKIQLFRKRSILGAQGFASFIFSLDRIHQHKSYAGQEWRRSILFIQRIASCALPLWRRGNDGSTFDDRHIDSKSACLVGDSAEFDVASVVVVIGSCFLRLGLFAGNGSGVDRKTGAEGVRAITTAPARLRSK
jgi:hypothetical protein